MKKQSDLDSLIGEALDNIRDDRKLAREFLNEIANQIAVDADNNRGLSPVARTTKTKYMIYFREILTDVQSTD